MIALEASPQASPVRITLQMSASRPSRSGNQGAGGLHYATVPLGKWSVEQNKFDFRRVLVSPRKATKVGFDSSTTISPSTCHFPILPLNLAYRIQEHVHSPPGRCIVVWIPGSIARIFSNRLTGPSRGEGFGFFFFSFLFFLFLFYFLFFSFLALLPAATTNVLLTESSGYPDRCRLHTDSMGEFQR